MIDRVTGFQTVREMHAMLRDRKPPELTPNHSTLVGLMDRYLYGLLDPFITLLEVHKLMYFMQVAGQRLRLKYTKGIHGPYAGNLRHVLNEVEGHFISGYSDSADRPNEPLQFVPGAVENAARILRRSPRTRERFDRVTDLIDGFESAFGLELLSTVHWVLERETPASGDELVALTYTWNERKKRFSPRQIGLAADVLRDKDWTGTPLAVPCQ